MSVFLSVPKSSLKTEVVLSVNGLSWFCNQLRLTMSKAALQNYRKPLNGYKMNFD